MSEALSNIDEAIDHIEHAARTLEAARETTRALLLRMEAAEAAAAASAAVAQTATAEVARLRAVITKAIDDLPEWSAGALKHLSPAEVMGDSVRMDLRRAVETGK